MIKIGQPFMINVGGNKPDGPKLLDLVEISFKAEREAMYFYEGLAELFHHLPEVAAFWNELADDEDEHVRLVDSLRMLLSDTDLDRPVDGELISKVSGFLKFNADEVLASIKTLDEAYKFSVNMEFSELNKLLEFLISDTLAEDGEKRAIIEKINDHQGKLKRFASRFGDSVWRREIEAQRPAQD